MNQKKVIVIYQWPTPKGVLELRLFLTLMNYYHKFI
ncbi:unnamed protein product [Spirodela intermedia]|uniref:Uncharacterized protein n=1 Tax=Spirodela intermedia TaxID=51605 RepID=A0A7I8K9T9_SPIIN|nr:unnamed protein product [Spirodela intermedia]